MRGSEIRNILCDNMQVKLLKVDNNVFWQRKPFKGEIIKMDLEGTGNKTYRVLSIAGTVAFVVGYGFHVGDSTQFGTTSTYRGSYVDEILNTDFYSSLTNNARIAIQSSEIKQFRYDRGTRTETHSSLADYSSKYEMDSMNRYIYALDVDDIETYFDGRFTNNDLYNLCGSTNHWLKSMSEGGANYIWYIDGEGSTFGINDSSAIYGTIKKIIPAFKIDLSKIEWTY